MRERNIEQEILNSVRAIKKGGGHKFTVNIPSDVKNVRSNLALSQAAFASFLGVSVRTLQDWEQGRRTPQGPALSLLKIADNNPSAFLHQ